MIPLLFTAALTIATGSPALAEQFSRAVSYHDLDLTKPDGVRTLQRRVRNAANKICGFGVTGSFIQREDRECRRAALSDVSLQVTRAIQMAESRSGRIELASR
ncbi:MAG TPA: UrcA family protein [Sphingomonas sp.]|nr:UrcA family protein [Sphingomonas sp.]